MRCVLIKKDTSDGFDFSKYAGMYNITPAWGSYIFENEEKAQEVQKYYPQYTIFSLSDALTYCIDMYTERILFECDRAEPNINYIRNCTRAIEHCRMRWL